MARNGTLFATHTWYLDLLLFSALAARSITLDQISYRSILKRFIRFPLYRITRPNVQGSPPSPLSRQGLTV